MSTAPWRSSGSVVSTTHKMSTPAFVPVTVRKSFGSAPQPSKPAEEPERREKIAWPDSVRSYVQRSFNPDQAIPGVAKEEVEVRLKTFISEAHRNGQLHDLDWDTMPLPQQMIIAERNQAALSMSTAPNPLTSAHSYDSSNKFTKKRKSPDSHYAPDGHDGAPPPWRASKLRQTDTTVTSSPSLADRMGQRPETESPSKFDSKKEKRLHRFGDSLRDHARTSSPPPDTGPVIGRSQSLEKKYFRLTSAPNPDHVRPLEVLEKTFAMLKDKWRKDSNYSYICDQFKSLRQDLVVQHIRNEFTVTVYETHARIALEKADLGEYNQCQTALRALYARGLKGHPLEFKAYRILYFIHTCNRADMNDLLADLTKAEKADTAVKHALDVRTATTLGNYHRLFQLYHAAPNMGAYLMDMFIDRERIAALAVMNKAYKNNIPVKFVAGELAIEDAQLVQFVIDNGGSAFVSDSAKGELEILTTPPSLQHFQASKDAAFKKVDIKGQI